MGGRTTAHVEHCCGSVSCLGVDKIMYDDGSLFARSSKLIMI